MKRVDLVEIHPHEGEVIVTFYKNVPCYNGEELCPALTGDELRDSYVEFAIGCFEVMVKAEEKLSLKEIEERIKEKEIELEELRRIMKEDESRYHYYKMIMEAGEEELERLKRRKKEIEELKDIYVGIDLKYSMGVLQVIYTEKYTYEEKIIDVEDSLDLNFKYLKLKIRKY